MTANSQYPSCSVSFVRPTGYLIGLAQTSDAEDAEGNYWEAVRILQHRLQNILERVRQLRMRRNKHDRALCATVLGQNSVKDKVSISECSAILIGMLSIESSATVNIAIAQALGHLGDPRAVDALLPLRTHVEPGVHQAIAFGLLWHKMPAAIAAMIELSSDPDRGTRNWAAFGLGQIDLNTVELREALLLRLSDEEEEIRGEALAGLALRCDPRALPGLLLELEACVREQRQITCRVYDTVEAVLRCPDSASNSKWCSAMLKLRSADSGGFLERVWPAEGPQQEDGRR